MAAAAAIAKPPTKADFQKVYDKISHAFETKNETEFLSHLTPDFTQVQNGKPPVDHAQIASAFQKQVSKFKSLHWERTVLTVTPDGPNFNVLVSSHLTTKMAENGKDHSYVMDSRSVDTFTPALKIQQSRVTKLKIIRDGKRLTLR